MVAEQTPGEDYGEVVAVPPLWLRLGRGLGRIVLSRRFALLLVLAALVSGALTYRALTGTTALAFSAKNVQVVLLADLVLVLMLCVVVLGAGHHRRRVLGAVSQSWNRILVQRAGAYRAR